MLNYRYSPDGIAITEGFEALRLNSYPDSGGVWTIGYGHTGKDVKPGMSVSLAQAIALLTADVSSAEAAVCRGVLVDITQHEFDALVDFAFNDGCVAFLHSTLLRKLNAGDFVGAADELLRWINVDGRKSAGLLRRRTAERALFMRDVVAVPAVADEATEAPTVEAFDAAVDASGKV